MQKRCEFCGEEIKTGICKCPDSLSTVYHMVNIFECLNHCDRMLRDVEDHEMDLSDAQIEKIITMCQEEKRRLNIELSDLLNEVGDEITPQE